MPQDQHLKRWNESENRPLLGELIIARKKEYRWAGLQLPIYAAFVMDHFQTGELPEVGYINLPRAIGDVGFCPWHGLDQRMLDHALTWGKAAIAAIKAGEFKQAAMLSSVEREWDDFSELAPDGLEAAFDI